jgi:hypothetical protein
MKKYLAVLSCVMIVILSCQKKSMPVISDRSTKPEASKPDTGIVIADTERGRIVFANRCGRCHGLPEPILYSVKRWETIMDNMASRARLSKADRVHVTAWVNLNAKKD